ncbi:protein BCCIP homolog isoform X2 [Aphidius gifuensis]|uniref:protein BCCIP homolog isoform X2 n=1 Tax=Aphidius gifuensis TaxID=684658 RepID=UPI001CDC9A58|nr:protein BCCIP homolog isoform X2 [Aphidius gifuensis]
MAGPAKKRDVEKKPEDEDEMNQTDEDSNDDNETEVNDEEGTKIMVDFVGRTPEDPDFHGIKILLKQLFLKAQVNVSALSEHIISRNYVGSVVKQGLDGDDDEEESDDDDDVNDVFGITTIVNISHSQNEECVQQLRTLLKDLSTEFADDKTNTTIKNILENDSSALGLIINERFVNIPADISIPLLENLIADMERACKKKMPYEFQYYVLISKLYKMKIQAGKKANKKKGNTEEPEVFWSNQEEEIFADDAMCTFEFSVDKETDSGLSGAWAEDDTEMTPFRRVMLFEAAKLPKLIEKVKTMLAN